MELDVSSCRLFDRRLLGFFKHIETDLCETLLHGRVHIISFSFAVDELSVQLEKVQVLEASSDVPAPMEE